MTHRMSPSLLPALPLFVSLIILLLVLGPTPSHTARRMALSSPVPTLRVQHIRSDPRSKAADRSGSPRKTPRSLAQTEQQNAEESLGLFTWPGVALETGPLQYGGGPLLTKPIDTHFVFYGNWAPNSGLSVLAGFVESLSTPSTGKNPSVYNWWQIMAGYTDSSGQAVSTQVRLGKNVTVSRSYRKILDDGLSGGNNNILGIVQTLIKKGKLPLDSGALYTVITSGDIRVGSSETGFCGATGYCGWHSQAEVDGVPIQFAFVGDATQQCNSGCGQNNWQSVTPNGHYAVDSLVSTFAHELTEAATDPDAATGYTATDANGVGWENADLCSTQFTDDANPTLLSTTNNAAYNLEGLNGLKFLVQTNVDLSSQTCVLQSSQSTNTPGPKASPPDSASSPVVQGPLSLQVQPVPPGSIPTDTEAPAPFTDSSLPPDVIFSPQGASTPEGVTLGEPPSVGTPNGFLSPTQEGSPPEDVTLVSPPSPDSPSSFISPPSGLLAPSSESIPPEGVTLNPPSASTPSSSVPPGGSGGGCGDGHGHRHGGNGDDGSWGEGQSGEAETGSWFGISGWF